jgi:NitT/TauT family transport system substrate-binding protein
MHIRSICAVSLAGAVIAILAAGCGAAGASTASAPAGAGPGEADVTVAAIPAVDLAGLYIAQEDGLFARQGLRVTIEKITSSQAIITDQLKGQVDITAGSYVAYIAAEAAGARFRILAEASTLGPGTRALVTTDGSPVTTIAGLEGKKIGVNGANSIGILLISTLLAEHGISPAKVDFVTDPDGFPAMPGQLQKGTWSAAFLAEPYITLAGEEYGDRVLADLDEGATSDFPIDGYVATRAWAQQNPRTAAAFVRAIEAGQKIANNNALAVQNAIAQYDQLPLQVTAAMEPSSYPLGPVVETHIQRVALSMLQFGLLGNQYAAEVEQGTLTESMIGPGS